MEFMYSDKSKSMPIINLPSCAAEGYVVGLCVCVCVHPSLCLCVCPCVNYIYNIIVNQSFTHMQCLWCKRIMNLPCVQV